MHQFMYMTTDQFVRQDGSQTPKLFIHNYVMALPKGCSWILPNALSNFTLPLGVSSWRRDSHHLKTRGRRRRNCVDGRRDDCLTFLFIQFAFFRINGQLRQRFVLHSLHTSMFILTISSGHPCKNRIKERGKFQKKNKKQKNKKKKKKSQSKRERRKYTYFFLLERFSLARILRVWVQGNDCTSDENLLGHRSRQSHQQILRQPEPNLGNNSPNQDARRLQNKQQKNGHIDEIKVVSQKEKGF